MLYEVITVFGVRPLQQVLLPQAGGRLQAFTLAWDTQRKTWFSLHPDGVITSYSIHYTKLYDVEPNQPMASGLPSWKQLSPEQRQRQARTMEVFAAMVANMDDNIGRLFDHLKKTGQYDNTIVIS